MSEFPPSNTESEFVRQLTDIQMALQLYVRSLLPGESAVGDVVQQTNVKLWELREEFTLGTEFKAWAFSVARYEVLNFRKQQARDRRLVFSEEVEDLLTGDCLKRNDDTAAMHDVLEACLGKLRTEQRELILGRYRGDESIDLMAKRLDRSADGLRVALHRLRTLLLECVRRQLSNPEVST